MKIIIIGSNGLLGGKFRFILSKRNEILGTAKSHNTTGFHYLDITNPKMVNNFICQNKPEVVIHTAALVNADYCETHKVEAKKINVEGTKNVVLACRKYKIKLVYISSDYIFSGKDGPYTEKSQPCPINYYGATKLSGEKIVKKFLTDYLIIRPGILYGYDDEHDRDTFPSIVIKSLKNNKSFIADDKIMKYPTLIDDVAMTIEKLLKINARGVYHCASQEGLTRYQWAKLVAESYNLPVNKIKPTETYSVASKPTDVLLLNNKIQGLGIDFITPEKGIKITKKQQGCMFKMIYSLRPDKLLLGQNTSQFRVKLGKKLAEEHPVKADRVMPIPDSGIFGAIGYSEKSKIPFYFGIIRDYKTEKTLYEPEIKKRSKMVNDKLLVLPETIKDQRIVLIDEAILTGVTLTNMVKKLKKAGVKEIHVRIFSPIMLYNCQNRILDSPVRFIAKKFDKPNLLLKKRIAFIENTLTKHFGVQSLKFLSLDNFLSPLSPKKRPKACLQCFLH